MGGQSQSDQQQSQTTTPYGPAQAQLNPLLNQLGTMGPTADRTGMVSDAYSQYQTNLAPTASGQFLDPNSNPFFSQAATGVADSVQGRLSALYAGSGRDPAGAGSYGGNLGKGIAEALAPMYANQYNAERQNQLAAQNSLYGAGGQTAGLLSSLDQIPLQQLLAKMGAVLPAASAFGTTTGTQSGTKEMSAVEEASGWANLAGSLFGGGKKG